MRRGNSAKSESAFVSARSLGRDFARLALALMATYAGTALASAASAATANAAAPGSPHDAAANATAEHVKSGATSALDQALHQVHHESDIQAGPEPGGAHAGTVTAIDSSDSGDLGLALASDCAFQFEAHTSAFTSAEASSFHYGGSSVFDAAPAGSHASGAGVLGTPDAAFSSLAALAIANSGPDGAAALPPGATAPVSGAVLSVLANDGKAAGGDHNPVAPTAAETPILVWSGDLGSHLHGGTGGGNTSSGGGSTTTTSAPSSGGLVINVVFDASCNNAPAGFETCVNAVATYFEQTFSNPITITIDVGYGEIAGQPLVPGALGESESCLTSVSYAQLETALAANAAALGYTAAAASFSAASPVNGQFWMTTAEAKALGLPDFNTGVDGYVGFSSIPTLFDYNQTGTVPTSQYYFFGVVAHEFSEVMGRQLMDGQTFNGSAGYEPMDLFHYSSPGVRDFSGTTPGYFSPDGGVTNLDAFNTNPNGDFGDWASSAGNDAFNAYSSPGTFNTMTSADLTVMNLLGWTPAAGGAAQEPSSSSNGQKSKPFMSWLKFKHTFHVNGDMTLSQALHASDQTLSGPSSANGAPSHANGGADAFVFHAKIGEAVIENFAAVHDGAVGALLATAATMAGEGSDAVVAHDVLDTIMLSHFTAQHLHAHGFHFSG